MFFLCGQTLSHCRKHKMCLVSIYKPSAQCERKYIKQFGAFGCSVAATIGQLNTVWCCNEKAQKCSTPWGEKYAACNQAALTDLYISLLFSWIKLDENEVKTNENLVRLLNSGTWEEAAQWWKKRRKNEKRKGSHNRQRKPTNPTTHFITRFGVP